MASNYPSAFEVPWFAKIFHSFPHLDLTFHAANSTFDPLDNNRYRESLVFWAALPVLWLLITLLLFLMYFCYRCCQRDVEKKQRVPCLRWTMAILAVFSCGIVGVGLYGNEEAHKGIKQFGSAIQEANDTLSALKYELNNVEREINGGVERGVEGLKDVFRSIQNRPLKREVRNMSEVGLQFAREVVTEIESINKKTDKVNLSGVAEYARMYEFWRWLATMLLHIWKILLCLLLLLGIGNSSKCTLLMFCAFGIFTLVLCWISAGFHLGVDVGIGDFCVNPNQFFEKLAADKNRELEEVTYHQDVVKYYLNCTGKSPFNKALNKAMTKLLQSNRTLHAAITKSEPQIHIDGAKNSQLSKVIMNLDKGMDGALASIQKLTGLSQCTNMYKDYRNAVNGICHVAMPGLIFILLAATVTGILFTILVLLASCAWRHFGKRKGYFVVDEEEHLPPPDNSSPTYYSFTRGHRSNPREHVPMQRRNSPPPYSTNEFYRNYADHNSSDVDQRSAGDLSGDCRA